jgi:glycine dehydrogenase subunit 1
MRYLPHTPEEVKAMLEAAGRGSIDELFATIPEAAQFSGELKLPAALSEAALMRHMSDLGAKNTGATMLSFLGAGMYAHHIPPAVDQLLLRSEFYTAYTPYQPEVAQGTLLAIFEFQTMVSELFGLPLANASLYDGASATAEGALMARRLTKRSKVLLSECVHPQYRATVQSYLSSTPEDVQELPLSASGTYDLSAVVNALDDSVACVVVGYPSYMGPLSDLREIAQLAHDRGALLVVAVTEPYALALAESPGALGADIVVGEGQAMAISPQFGGPGVGLFACRDDKRFLQQLPGRVCGETVDQDGRRGYVLTLSTREQHIRRERATSNICTNQGLVALAFTIRVALLGKSGFVQVGEQCAAKARYLRKRLSAISGLELCYESAPWFNEFCVRVRSGTAQQTLARLEAQGILGGVDVGTLDKRYADRILIAVTEQHTREDLDRLINAYAGA